MLCHRISVWQWFKGTWHIYIQWLRDPKKKSSWILESVHKSYLAFWFVVGWLVSEPLQYPPKPNLVTLKV